MFLQPTRNNIDIVGQAQAVEPAFSAIRNSLGIVIEKPILEPLDIDRDTELEMTGDGTLLILEPVRRGRRKRVAAAAKRVMDAHDATLRKLAK